MDKEIINVPVLSDACKKSQVPLSPVVKAGGFLFVSGMPGMDLKTGAIPGGDMLTQMRMSMETVKHCLEAAGSSLDKVVKATIYITNAAYFDDVNEIYRSYFPKDPPARVFCVVGSWPRKFDVEVECIAIA
jgi:reactive intermediate/imine deaminase